jgi:mannitol-specific phosphotransferase system IIBC component
MEDHAKELGVMVAIIVPLALFAMIFGIVYLAKRERMAMIERGMDPRRYKPQSAPFQNLKWGLLLIGAGIGLFLAYLLDHTVFKHMAGEFDNDDNAAIYFSLIAIFGGIGLFLSYIIEKKEAEKEDKNKLEE